MKKLETLTPEQKAKMIEVRDFWINYINSCSHTINRDEAKIGIDFIYQLAKCSTPKIIYVESPLACQYAVHLLKQISETLPQMPIATASVRDSVVDSVGDSVRDSKINFESFSAFGGIGDYGWVSFYDFFTQIGVVNHEKFNRFKKLILSGVYDMIQLNGFCIVCGLPSELTRNIAGRLHSIEGAAIKWKDGCEFHFVNGRALPERHFKTISDKKFSMEDFINEPNEEYKSTCIALMQELYGDEYLVHFFSEHMKEVDAFVDKKKDIYLRGTTKGMNIGVYTLFTGEINGEKISYVRCYCPSTDRMFFLGVENIYTNAKDAIASLYRVPRRLVDHIKSISRQGERYNTVFTDKGNELLSVLNTEEISDLASVSGDRYFELMKYEY